MFTPEGYWSWEEANLASVEWSRNIAILQRYPSEAPSLLSLGGHRQEKTLLSKLVEDGYASNHSEAAFALDVAALWLLANFLDVFDAVLCSPENGILRCPVQLKTHGDAFDWWSWPLTLEKFGQGETSSYLNYFREGNFGILDAHARFCAIDPLSGQIRLKPNSISLFHGSSYGHGVPNEEISKWIDEQVRPFVGWSICWNPKDIPDTEDSLFEELGFDELGWRLLGQKNTRNSPINIVPHENVIDCINIAFPHGKGAATWDDVQAKVGYSRRTIVRALRNEGRWPDWARGGRNVGN